MGQEMVINNLLDLTIKEVADVPLKTLSNQLKSKEYPYKQLDHLAKVIDMLKGVNSSPKRLGEKFASDCWRIIGLLDTELPECLKAIRDELKADELDKVIRTLQQLRSSYPLPDKGDD